MRNKKFIIGISAAALLLAVTYVLGSGATIIDTFTDTSKIGSSSNTGVSSGQLKLSYNLAGAGTPCASGANCTSGYCYRDADADGYAAASGDMTCKAVASLGADCYDSNANAKPGQTAYFTVNRGDGSWDYNCSGSTEKSNCNGVACTLGGLSSAGYPACGGVPSGYTTCSNPAYEASCGAAWTSYAACSVTGQLYTIAKGYVCYVTASVYGCSSTGYTCSCH